MKWILTKLFNFESDFKTVTKIKQFCAEALKSEIIDMKPKDVNREKGKNKPLIGVLPLWDAQKESIWMLPDYMDALAQAGALPFILPLKAAADDVERLLELCDGLLFTGGQDVAPAIYGMEDQTGKTELAELRDSLEIRVLELALRRDMPLFGICRGLQFINAFLGGTLYQDLPTQHLSDTTHSQGRPYSQPVHRVELQGALKELLGRQTLQVNSLHHQAIKELAPELQTMALSEDGLIEAVCLPSKKFVWAVQWHPEFLFRTDESSRTLFSTFVSACKSSV